MSEETPAVVAPASLEAVAAAITAPTTKPINAAEPPVEQAKPLEIIKPPEAIAPQAEFSLKLPDGTVLGQSDLDEIVSFAKEQGLSQKQAEAYLTRKNAERKIYEESHKPGGEAWKKKEAEWSAAALADKEIGGSEENLRENAEIGKRVIDAAFPPSMKKFLVDTGLGSHPDVIRGFAKIGRMIGEDKSVKSGRLSQQPRSLADRAYPNHKTE